MDPKIIVIALIIIIIGGAVLYIIKAKKSGAKCIGCPYSKKCHTNKKYVLKRPNKNESYCSCECSNNDK